MNLEDIISGDVPRLTKEEAEVLEGVITEEEALRSLQKMKKKKSPGTDGFSVEFLKVFFFFFERYRYFCC